MIDILTACGLTGDLPAADFAAGRLTRLIAGEGEWEDADNSCWYWDGNLTAKRGTFQLWHYDDDAEPHIVVITQGQRKLRYNWTESTKERLAISVRKLLDILDKPKDLKLWSVTTSGGRRGSIPMAGGNHLVLADCKEQAEAFVAAKDGRPIKSTKAVNMSRPGIVG